MARITVEDCLDKIGNENRFRLVHLGVARVKQHRRGLPYLVKTRNKEAVATLREIAAGRISFNNIKEFNKLPEEEGQKVEDSTGVDKSATK